MLNINWLTASGTDSVTDPFTGIYGNVNQLPVTINTDTVVLRLFLRKLGQK